MRKIIRILSSAAVITGIGLLLWTIYPILSFELIYSSKFQGLIKPVPNESAPYTIADLPQILGIENADYTKASVWFPKANNLKLLSSSASYTLSVPKVGIENASVVIGAEDLSQNLSQFTGPLPGSYGNPVIFGHSTLLWFYNPKDYKAIFSKLPELNIGDEILTTVDEVTFRYKVNEMFIVFPDDLSVLSQNYESQNITLVTCVPPGTYLKRLVVRATLDHNL